MVLHGAKDFFDCDHAVMATNGGVLEDALQVASKLNIEILKIDFAYQDETHEIEKASFEAVWTKYIFPLKGKEISKDGGAKNTILNVDWSGIKRLSSNGKASSINIEIFRESFKILMQQGYITRDYINQNYLGRASSGVILILSQLPFVELKEKPICLYVKTVKL